MNVLFTVAEVTPFSKVGGMADVAGALPRALEAFEVETKIITPCYRQVIESSPELKTVGEVSVFLAGESHDAVIRRGVLPESNNVEVLFVDNEHYFGREGIYVDPNTGAGYPDEDERFLFFMRAILGWLEQTDWIPEILHVNDHHTALLPMYVKELERFGRFRTLFTIHNLGYQGIYPRDVLEKIGVSETVYVENPAFEYKGDVNFLKIGLRYADKINTVSPTYAEEIMFSDEYGFGLQQELMRRADDVSGILNGVDYTEWNPETDTLIPYNFTSRDLKGKKKNRDELLRKNRLVAPTGTPVIGMVSRLVDQKGFDLLGDIIDDLLSMDLRMIILGTGEKKYHRLLQEAKAGNPDKIAVSFDYNNPMAHLIEAGSDMFLMPSKYEPCGLNQMYSLRYGTIPIVHATGGLADTIADFDKASKEGTGFVFNEYTGEAMLTAIKRAIDTFRNKALWKFIRDNAMDQDFSWHVSAEKYYQLYQSILNS